MHPLLPKEDKMSKHWGYVCQSHNPAIESERWLNHGEKVLADVFRLERAGQWPNVPEGHPYYLAYKGEPMLVNPAASDMIGSPGPDGSGGLHLVHWLREHPHCVVAMCSEYGEIRPLADPAPQPQPTVPFTSQETDPLESIRNLVAFDSRDWAQERAGAWLYGIVFGWDGHGELEDEGAMDLIAARHGWTPEHVERLRVLHERFKATVAAAPDTV